MRRLWVLFGLMPCLLLAQTAADKGIRLKNDKAADVYSEQRVALVIGNGAYHADPLRNPVNDAEDIAKTLTARKFDVAKVTNADKRAMEEAIEAFGERLKKGGTGVFYYSGHGVQVDGVNYLIPIATDIQSEKDIKYKAVNAGLVLSVMEEAGNRVNILILDACRDNPYARSFKTLSKGLVKMDAPKGTYIAYATAPGTTAADGEGRNGVYTKWLLKEMTKPGRKESDLFKAVREGVMRDTADKQVPWDATCLTGDFYFTPIDFDDGRMALTEAELKRLRQLEEEQRRADEEKARIEAEAKVKQAALDQEVAKLKAQLKVQSTSGTLDALAALADQRAQLAVQLRETQRKATEEKQKREAEIAQLKAQEHANRKAKFVERYAKYRKTVGSEFLNDEEKAAAWKAICEEWQVAKPDPKPGELAWDEDNGCVIACVGGFVPKGSAGKTMTLDLGGGVKMEFVWVEALKGWVGKYEVTNQEYRRFKKDHDSGKHEGQTLNEDRQPVVQVSYDDATAFADWVNKQAAASIPSGYKARLPDGKEWTTFAQCGDGRAFPWGNDWPPKQGNYADATAKKSFSGWTVIDGYDDGFAVSCPVEKSGANDWGLYGVGGNVWEWTSEQDGSVRVLRGASWYLFGLGGLRCECRYWFVPSGRDGIFGFRLVVLR